MRKTVLALACFGLAVSGVATAHARLKTAVPAVGATVAEAPQDLRLKFSEAVAAASAIVVLSSESGEKLPGELGGDAADPSVLVLKCPGPLAPGNYRVSWAVVTDDDTKTQGSYNFHVGQ